MLYGLQEPSPNDAVEREKVRRAAADETLLIAVEQCSALSPFAGKAIWLAQLATWISEPSRGPALEAVIKSLREPTPRSDLELLRTFEALTIVADEAGLRDVAREVMQGLPNQDTVWELKLRLPSVWNFDLPPLEQLLIDLPSDERRLDALVRLDDGTSKDVLCDLLRAGLPSFRDVNLRAAGCAHLLRRIGSAVSEATVVDRMLSLALEADDSIAKTLLTWLPFAAGEQDMDRVYKAKAQLYLADSDPEHRARGLFSGVLYGLPANLAADLAHSGIEAIKEIEDEAVQAELLRLYVYSVPGGAIWEQDVTLGIADGITDQRLRALAYSACMFLSDVGHTAFKHGLELTDEWARAAVVFEWSTWAQTPPGFTVEQWARTRREAAYAVPQSQPRARYLAILAAESTGTDRDQFAEDALAAARTIVNPSGRAWAIHNLVCRRLIPQSQEAEAVAAAWEIRSPAARYRMLAKLSRFVDVGEMVRLLTRLADEVVHQADRIDFCELCDPPGLGMDFGFIDRYWTEYTPSTRLRES
jgi:hypothetical protein